MRPVVGVYRDRGARYLLLTIVSFAVTVLSVRVYLDSAGYPTVGVGGLHVAHMLWGGLLLVVAAVLLQLFVGRRALVLSSIAAGIGVGLFIDEVGKFITESNDYFFAPAAPLIYGAVLLLVLVWLRVQRDDQPTPPEATQGAIEALRDLADGRLSVADRDRAVARLQAVGTIPDRGLPGALMSVLASADTDTRLADPGPVRAATARRWFRWLLPERLERLIIRIGLLLLTLAAALGALIAMAILSGEIPSVTDVASGPIEYPDDPFWVLCLVAVWIVVGAASGLALGLSLVGRLRAGMVLAQYALLLGLVAGGLLDTFVSQLGALSGVIIQPGLLLLIMDQRSRIEARSTTS